MSPLTKATQSLDRRDADASAYATSRTPERSTRGRPRTVDEGRRPSRGREGTHEFLDVAFRQRERFPQRPAGLDVDATCAVAREV
jgi:hypothetical protein